ncbi:MAG: hypothetical protein R3B90_07930 [Planctomycetaceae bacterium]
MVRRAAGTGTAVPPGGALQHTVSKPEQQQDYIIGARISSKDEHGVNAIVLSDLEFMGDRLFDLWERQDVDLTIDNVLLLLNCVDSLAGNDEFLTLRGRYRRQARTRGSRASPRARSSAI